MRHLSAFLIPMVMIGANPAFASNNADEGERLICKRQQETGSRFGKKVCKTAKEWEEMSEQHRRGLGEMVNRPQIEIRK
ncbi:MAG: hypothetical protein WAR58_07320 [Sphingorhabdus sp.]|jgi:hypothetical protein